MDIKWKNYGIIINAETNIVQNLFLNYELNLRIEMIDTFSKPDLKNYLSFEKYLEISLLNKSFFQT